MSLYALTIQALFSQAASLQLLVVPHRASMAYSLWYINADLFRSLQKRALDYERHGLENDMVTQEDIDEVLFPKNAGTEILLVPAILKLRHKPAADVLTDLRRTPMYSVASSVEEAMQVIARAVKSAPASEEDRLPAWKWMQNIGLDEGASAKRPRNAFA